MTRRNVQHVWAGPKPRMTTWLRRHIVHRLMRRKSKLPQSDVSLMSMMQRKRGARWQSVDGKVVLTSATPLPQTDLGLRRDQIHDARLIRDAEVAEPGFVRRTLEDKLERGEAPTRSAVRRAAEDRLQRSLDRLQRVQESVRQIEATKPAPLTPEQQAIQIAVFGTQEDRAIHERLVEIVERIDEQPSPSEAVRRIPPASRHAVETAPMRRAAAWLTDFTTLYEQEVQNGTDATE